MSKPDLPGNSLEEILASIRKTLTDDRPEDGLSKLDNLPPAAQDDGAPGMNGHGVNGADTLPDRLVDALGSDGKRHAELDLTALLNADAANRTEAPKSDGGNDDMPWFLSRGAQPSEPEAKPAATKPAAASVEVEPPQPAAPEEIALTRPETVRRSFPPLFGGGEALPSRQADIPSRPSDVLLTPKSQREPVAEPAKPAAPVEAKARPAEPVAPVVEKPVVLPEPPAKVAAAPLAREVPVAARSVPARPEPVAAVWSEPPLPEQLTPEAPLPEPRRPEPARAEAVAEQPVNPQSQALQEMIGRLLEPVIQQWLDRNLPSMVEGAIRAEMERQFKRPRGELKI
jgi:cell pole-organizing protein PopZ